MKTLFSNINAALSRKYISLILYAIFLMFSFLLIIANQLMGIFSGIVFWILSWIIYRVLLIRKNVFYFALCLFLSCAISFWAMLVINTGLLFSSLRTKIAHGIVVKWGGEVTDHAFNYILESVIAASLVYFVAKLIHIRSSKV